MKEIKTGELLERIGSADAGELNEIISAVTERFREVWPEWDLLIISVEGRTPADHVRALNQSIGLTSAAVIPSD